MRRARDGRDSNAATATRVSFVRRRRERPGPGLGPGDAAERLT